jgi:hypothetical protein
MGKYSLYKSVAIIAFAGIASGAFANPIAPWHNPTTPQNYSPKQRWSTGCAANEDWQRRIMKKAGKPIKPEKIKGGGLLFSTESFHMKRLMGLRIDTRTYDYLEAKVKGGKVEYYYTIQDTDTYYIYDYHPDLNIRSLDVKIGGQLVSYGNAVEFESKPIANTGTAVVTYSATATSTIPLDERLVEYVANQPDSNLVESAVWNRDGLAGSCPNYLHPAEFRAIRDAAAKAVAG